tara:strand:+ start:144 stop:467 length:324 start_codon:yes stop_codon:yes gene_type:complete
MVPLLHDGDFLVVRQVFWSGDIRNGNIVTVKHPQFGQIVKAIISVTPETVKLSGLSTMSASIDALGVVKKESIDGVGVAVIARHAKNDSNTAWLRFLKNNDIQKVLA